MQQVWRYTLPVKGKACQFAARPIDTICLHVALKSEVRLIGHLLSAASWNISGEQFKANISTLSASWVPSVGISHIVKDNI